MNYNLEHPLLSSEAERKRRRDLLLEPHMKALSEYLCSLRAKLPEDVRIPDFDPCDGGINARALFLLEAPQNDLAFISRENPNPAATNFRELLIEAKIARKDTIVWNVVPWRVEKNINEVDIRRALPHLEEVLRLLSSIKVIIFMGKKAQTAYPYLRNTSGAIIKMTWMPSSPSLYGHNKKPEVQATLQEVTDILNG